MAVLLLLIRPGLAAASSDSEIVLGISAAFSGPSQLLGRQMRAGLEARFLEANRDGGVNGRRIRLIAHDDGYEPEAAIRNMSRLIDEEEVLAVIGNVGTPTAAVTVPIAIEKGVLLFGAFTGAGLLRRDPPDRYVINYRASYAQETGAIIDGLLRGGIRPYEIAFFTQNDAYGDAGHSGAIAALERAGYLEAAKLPHGRYDRNSLRVEEGLLTILKADRETRAIVMVGAYQPCADFIRLARQLLPGTLFLSVSFVGSAALAQELGSASEGVIVTQVVPHYDSEWKLVRRYRQSLARHAPEEQPGFVSLEGYIVAHLFLEGLRRAGAAPDRESIIDAIERLGKVDLGLGEEIRFGPSRHQGSDGVWPTIIRDGRFEPFDWGELEPPDRRRD